MSRGSYYRRSPRYVKRDMSLYVYFMDQELQQYIVVRGWCVDSTCGFDPAFTLLISIRRNRLGCILMKY